MNNKKTIIILILVLTMGIVGLTIAYFSNSTSVENQFTTQPYGTTVEESFISPSNWLPGDETPKTIKATNSGNVDEAVRITFTEGWIPNKAGSTLSGWIHADGTKSSHTTESELANDERVAVINFDNDSDWYYEDGYYYYKYKITPGEKTSSLIKSVTFNPNTKLDDTCVTTEGNGTKTITCNSSGEDYDHATYTLTFTVETVQYDKYAEAWQLPNNTTIAIGGFKPQGVNFAQAIMSKSNAVSITNYTDGVTTEAYTFNHDATEQTPALTDYRYIGASPNNYVEFNCDDNGENCEVWRAIGVFYVDDGNNNWEWRVKLVRNYLLPNMMGWNEMGNMSNDWTDSNANLKKFLNVNYLSRSEETTSYGLTSLSIDFIDDAKYYLGSKDTDWGTSLHRTPEEVYAWERGKTLCGSCESDNSKLSWIGKVGIMYLSDFYMVYINDVDTVCYNSPNECREFDMNYSTYKYDQIRDNPGYPQSGWIYNSNVKENQTDKMEIWLLTTDNSNTGGYIIRNLGHVSNATIGMYSAGVRPVLYLKSSVKTTSGDGSIDSPYKLSL